MKLIGNRTGAAPGLALLVLLTVPQFFAIYRTAVFQTVPRDDYAPYLLWLADDGGEMMPAPFAYRVLSVAVALPVYYVAPVLRFSQQPEADARYLRATLALTAVSYASLLAIAACTYALARRRCGASGAAALLAAAVSFLLSGFISRTGVDPIAIYTISALLLLLDRPWIFAALVLLSVGINEKIPILFAVLLLARRLQPQSFRDLRGSGQNVQLIAACLAVAVYFAIAALLQIPGNEHQTSIGLFARHLADSLVYTLSLKGMVLNALPVVVLLLLFGLAVRMRERNGFRPADLSALVVLVVLAMLADVVYNMGRIAMYAWPVYLPAASVAVDALLENRKSEG